MVKQETNEQLNSVELTAIETRPSEAAFVAWTDIMVNGTVWSITLREGITDDLLAQMFSAIAHLPVAGEQVLGEGAVEVIGKELRYQPAPYQPPKTNGAQPANGAATAPTSTGGWTEHGVPWAAGIAEFTREPDGEGHLVHIIDRILVSGTKDAPKVEMFSHNKKLKFPIAKPPASIVAGKLGDKYGLAGNDLMFLSDTGTEQAVQWVVTFNRSEKNEKWLDLVSIWWAEFEEQKPASAPTTNALASEPTVAVIAAPTDATSFWHWAYKWLSPRLAAVHPAAEVTAAAHAAVKASEGNFVDAYALLLAQYDDELAEE